MAFVKVSSYDDGKTLHQGQKILMHLSRNLYLFTTTEYSELQNNCDGSTSTRLLFKEASALGCIDAHSNIKHVGNKRKDYE